jgi:hypothetical protein
MGHALIDTAVVLILFGFGIGWTIFRYGRRDRLAFAVVAILSPAIAVFALFMVLARLISGRPLQVGPCPNGLEEAELMVEEERQRLFGGDLRQPTYSRSWQRAYELELQRDATTVQQFAQRVFVPKVA